nr:2-oxoglutarate (2OG) and Fe(II)-dependent oxygenase superfamily protein [Tanacetum cinerariifolium]
MVLDSTSTIKPDYDRKAELIAFDQTKMGVKEIIDGITQVPRVFHIPSPRTLKNSVEPSFSKPCLPTIDLEGIDEDSIRQKEVIKEVKDAPETWGFFRMVNVLEYEQI